MRKIFIITISIFLFSVFANAQGAVSYRFLEVVDYAKKPIAEATVKIEASCDGGEQKTNSKGQLEKGLPIGVGDCYTDNFTISKAGYFPFADIFGITYHSREPITIELLKIPKTRVERKAIGNEQLKRELFVAAKTGDEIIVRKLLKSGLSPNLTTSDLRGVPGDKNIPVIVFAALSGDDQTLNEFLSAGVTVRKLPNILLIYLTASPYPRRYSANDTERNALIKSIENGVENLIKAGANINTLDSQKSTTLMIAAKNGYVKSVKLLIEKGVPVDAKDSFGRTALMSVVSAELEPKLQLETADLLLKAGADPNMFHETGYYRSQNCQTPLIHAIGNSEMVKLLIANKADVNLACQNGETPLQYAKELQTHGFHDYRETIKLLEAAGAK